jgi:hypothetical protein
MKPLILALLGPTLFAQNPSTAEIRSAATRTIALLQKGPIGFSKTQDCFSCHNTGLPAQALEIARSAPIKALSRTVSDGGIAGSTL